MTARMSTPVPWPNPSEVFALEYRRHARAADPDRHHDLRADHAAAARWRWRSISAIAATARKTAALMLLTAAFGATFVGMQAFEWTKLITEGVRPWENPWGAAQFGSTFFMITGFHGTHVTIGVIFLLDRGAQGLARRFRHRHGAASSRAARAATRSSRSPASTGTSSTWCGCSSSRSSISGEAVMARQRHMHSLSAGMPTPERPAASDPALSRGLGPGCSCSAPAPTWSTISASRAICDGR